MISMLHHVLGNSKSTHLVLFEAVLKDVLDNQAARLAKSYLMPHA